MPFLELGFTWSPDGKQIAFVGSNTRLSDSAIYVVNSDGSGLAQLTSPKGISADAEPDWSPDGTQIAYVRDGFRIIVMNPDGTGQRLLNRGELGGWSPVWSPDGTRIAFVGSERIRQFDLYVMSRDGSGQRNLTGTRSPNESDPDPRRSPDGRRIVFESLRHPDLDVHLIRTDGTRHVNLARSPKYDAEPDWSPDGASIVFASTRDGNRDIYAMTAAGRNQTNLTNGSVGTRNSAPAYSPLVQRTRLELPLLDPQFRRDLGIVAAHLLDEALRVLAPDEHLELDAEREVGREGVVNDGVDDHGGNEDLDRLERWALIGLGQLGSVRRVLLQDRLHRLQILERELAEVVLQQLLGAHACIDHKRRGPKAAIGQPLPSLDPVRSSGALVVHHREHVLGDCLTVLAHELAHAPAEALRTPARISADTRREALACHSADSRCFRSALNDAHVISVPIE